MFASCSVWCWILNVMALSPQQCARSQSSRHGQWNRTWSGQADRPSLKNPWLFLCNKAMIMVSDDGYARPRDPCLFETTRTKHSRHHLTSNFNIFDARAVPITKPNPSAPIIIIHAQNSIYGNHFSVCFDEACCCMTALKKVQHAFYILKLSKYQSIHAFLSSVARWIYSFCVSVCVCGRICMCVCKWCVGSLRV